jgi:hypothetical protein
MLVGRFGPLQDQIEPQARFVVLARQRERRLVNGLRIAIPQNLLEVVADALVMLERFTFRLIAGSGLVLERDLEPLCR